MLGLSGGRVVGQTHNGNTLLQLNKNYPLGPKGTLLQLPRDKVLFESVRRRGTWELQECEFLALGLRKTESYLNNRTALLDIGANTGLVTLQTMNLSKTSNEVFLFEPIPRHASAIAHNLRNLSNININQFGLSDQNSTSDIFTEGRNHGNTSTLKSAVPKFGQIRTQIELVDTLQYCDEFLNKFDRYVIKCDTQGMDAKILSRIPNRIWRGTETAIVEVWALPEVSELDVTTLLLLFKDFEFVSWNSKSLERIDFDEISAYWLSKSGLFRNLFLS
jgi:FkbM family methyltransferase